jgi:hypothetical protein
MAIDSASPLDIDSAINFDTNGKIDIDSAINTAVSIVVPAIIDINPSETEVDIAGSTIIDTASPSAADLTPAAIIIDPTSGMAGAVSTVTGGFDMAFELFNFHVNNDRVAELISISDSTPPRSSSKRATSYRGQSLNDHTAGAIGGGGTKVGDFGPVSWVERFRRSTTISNHRLLR